ncbi:RING-4 like protein [Metarhizium album ARSEF 1941]|uniref:RING-4 like protein n=1 Tax=Metarhizium album (strain ARSEF 1941) TaxID=1081103 RepID=A0A0B2WRC2_METAS|nr:RING-4 like protein [Metarhizium album ARSEF 1941]KHN96047.1 RING-4 like protein [Metarhizium album ARSEF 1941]
MAVGHKMKKRTRKTPPRSLSASGDKRKKRPGSERGGKRFQVSRACGRCKLLRRGCEERRPCGRCVRAGRADDCVAPPGPASAPASASSTAGVGASPEWTLVADVAASAPVAECADLFFDNCYPTIPVLTPEYIRRLQTSAAASASASPAPARAEAEAEAEACVLLVAFCAFVLLHVHEPPGARSNRQYGAQLLARASAACRAVCWGLTPSLDACLVSFFLYAGHTRLSRHSQAFLFLRQATALWVLVKDRRPPDADPDAERALLFERLFWVLVASERSHAIRYGRSITLHLTPDTPDLDELRTSAPALWSLAALFRPVDSAFMAVLNREAAAPAPAPAPDVLAAAERCIDAAVPAHLPFRDVQKANLRITRLWLCIVIWQLRLRLGHLTDASHQRSLTYRYPLDVARELVAATRDLPTQAMEVHGVGLTEKLFDIASAVVHVTAGVPRQPDPRAPPPGDDDLRYIRRLVVQLPGGRDVYDGLLESHVEQALRSRLRARRGHADG